MRKLLIDGVEVLGIEVNMKGPYQENEDYDFGGVTISRGGREFTIDVIQVYRYNEDTDIRFELGVEVDYDTFPKEEYKYNITKEDLFLDDIEVKLYIGGTFTNEILDMSLEVKFEDGTIKQIIVIED